MSELSEKLRSNMQDLQETITRLTLPEDTTRGTKETELPEPVDVMEDRPGLGFTPPGADRVPLALSGSLGDKPAPGFVRPETHAPVFMPVRYVVDPQNDAFFKLFVFPESFSSLLNYLMNMLQSCSEQEIVILFAQFMNSLMTEATARRILEAYISMKAHCTQETGAPFTMSICASLAMLVGRTEPHPASSASIGRKQPLWSMDVYGSSSWPWQAWLGSLALQSRSLDAPSATYVMDEITWILAPRDGRPLGSRQRTSSQVHRRRPNPSWHTPSMPPKWPNNLCAPQLRQRLLWRTRCQCSSE